MKISTLPNTARKADELNALVFTDFDDSDTNPRPGLGYHQLYDPQASVGMIAHLPEVSRTGDTARLYWGVNNEVQQYVVDDAITEKGWLSFSVPTALAQPPGHEVSYSLTDAFGQVSTSPTRFIAVDRRPPGGLDTDTGTAINEHLAPCTVKPPLIEDKNEIVFVTVPKWIDAAVGDELTVMWNNIRVDVPKLDETAYNTLVATGKVDVQIPFDVLTAGGSSPKLMVNYEIRDIVDNYSLVSPATLVPVDIIKGALTEPRVQEADRTTLILDLEALGDKDGHVLIPSYLGNYNPYIGTLEWTGKTPTTEIKLTLDPQTVNDPEFEHATFIIPNAHLKAIAGGSAVVRYTLVQVGDAETKKSKTTSITLTGLPVQLDVLALIGAAGGVIDLAIVTGDPVTVHAPAYAGQTAGDRILLSWTGASATGTPVNYPAEYTVPAGGETGEVSFNVLRLNLEPLGGGTLQLSYQVIRANGSAQSSPVTNYTVTAVALVFPAPVIVEVLDGTLKPINVVGGATFRASYPGMRATDTIVPAWNDISDTIPWRLGEPGGFPPDTVESPVPAAMIGTVIDKTIDVRYQVQRDGQGYWSDVLKLTIEAIPSASLPTPYITQASGGSLDVGALQSDADINVDPWPFIAVGQQMWMRLEGSSNLDLPSWQGYEIGSVNAQASKVPLSYLQGLADGSQLRLVLEVSFDGGLTRQAFPVQSYTVIAQPDVVVPVITAVTTADGVPIEHGGSTSSTSLTLTGTAGPATQIRLYDGETPLNAVSVDAQGRWTYQASGLVVSSHRFTARVVGMEEFASNLWVVEIIDAPLVVDTSTLVLSAHLVRSGRIPTHPPAGTTATRVATGGTPPYRYSVDSNAVDIDATTGTVISHRNRQGVVTVTDSAGQTAYYTVSVSNVLEIDGWNGQQNYNGAATNAANYGGRIPSQYEWRDFRSAYGGDPQLPADANEHAWSSTSAGGSSHYTIIPNNGSEATQVNYRFAKGWAIVVRS